MSGSDLSNATADLATTCFTCAPLEKYLGLTDSFAEKVASGLHDPIFILYGSLATLWVVWSGMRLVLHMTDLIKIGHEFIFISIAAILVGSQGAELISHVYKVSISVMGGAADVAWNVTKIEGEESTGYSGIVRLAANGELAVSKVVQASAAIAKAGSLYNLFDYIYAIVLVVPYFLLVVSYSSQIVVAIFRVTLVATFAPFLSLAFGFGMTRPMFASGCKTLLATILVLFACTVSLALTIYGVSQIDINPANAKELDELASISNPKFLMILFLGWMGTALMTEGTSIANSIAQTALSNAAAGIMTAGAAATAMLTKTQSAKGAAALGNLGSKNRDRLWDGAAAALDRFKNINKPGGGTP